MNKRVIFFILAILAAFSAVSCSSRVNDIDVAAAGAKMLAEFVPGGNGAVYSTGGTALDEDLFAGYFGDVTGGFGLSSISSYYVYIDETAPTKPSEFAVFRLAEGADGEKLLAYLRARIDLKIANARSYPSVDVSPLKTAVFGSMGDYVWYSAIKDNNQALEDYLKKELTK